MTASFQRLYPSEPSLLSQYGAVAARRVHREDAGALDRFTSLKRVLHHVTATFPRDVFNIYAGTQAFYQRVSTTPPSMYVYTETHPTSRPPHFHELSHGNAMVAPYITCHTLTHLARDVR